MKIKLKQRLISGITAFSIFTSALFPAVTVFSEEMPTIEPAETSAVETVSEPEKEIVPTEPENAEPISSGDTAENTVNTDTVQELADPIGGVFSVSNTTVDISMTVENGTYITDSDEEIPPECVSFFAYGISIDDYTYEIDIDRRVKCVRAYNTLFNFGSERVTAISDNVRVNYAFLDSVPEEYADSVAVYTIQNSRWEQISTDYPVIEDGFVKSVSFDAALPDLDMFCVVWTDPESVKPDEAILSSDRTFEYSDDTITAAATAFEGAVFTGDDPETEDDLPENANNVRLAVDKISEDDERYALFDIKEGETVRVFAQRFYSEKYENVTVSSYETAVTYTLSEPVPADKSYSVMAFAPADGHMAMLPAEKIIEDGYIKAIKFTVKGDVFAVFENISLNTLTVSEENKYTITVKYDKGAGIPAGAELRVKEENAEDYLKDTADALGWSEEDYIFYTRFFDISIVKDGIEYEPKTPVIVTADLHDAEEAPETLQVVHIDDEGAQEVEIGAADNAQITFEAESFSVYGFGSALHAVISESTDEAEFAVYSALSDNGITAVSAEIAEPVEGLKAEKAYKFTVNEGAVIGKLWVKAEVNSEAELDERESLAVYSVRNNAAVSPIVEDITAEGRLCPVDIGVDSVALIKDSGFRRLSFAMPIDGEESGKAVKMDGMMPKNAEGRAIDVTGGFARAYQENMSDQSLLAAYDLSILENTVTEDGTASNTKYQPGEERPVHIVITDGRISGDNIILYHITDDGECEEIENLEVSEGKIEFEAVGFSVYEIVTKFKPDNFYYNISGGFGYINPVEGWQKVNSISILNDPKYSINSDKEYKGFYISAVEEQKGRFAKNFTQLKVRDNDNRTGLAVTDQITDDSGKYPTDAAADYNQIITKAADVNQAAKYYFQQVSENDYYIFCLNDSDEKQYVKAYFPSGTNSLKLVSESERDEDSAPCIWTLVCTNGIFSLYNAETERYWNNSEAKNGKNHGFATWTGRQGFNIWYYNEILDDPYDFDGKTFGMINRSKATDTNGYALANTFDSNTIGSVKVTYDTANKNYKNINKAYISGWTFENKGKLAYQISTMTTDGNKVYIALRDDGATLTDDPNDEDTNLLVLAGTDVNFEGKIKIAKWTDTEKRELFKNGSNLFGKTTAGTTENLNRYFELVDLSGQDLTYGIMYYKEGTHGYALMDSDPTHSLIQLITRDNNGKKSTYFVDEGSEVTRWTFRNVYGNYYTLSSPLGYLKINGTKLEMGTEDEADIFEKIDDTETNSAKFRLKCGDLYIAHKSEGEDNNRKHSFYLTDNIDEDTLLTPVKFAKVDNKITYSANRISVSSLIDREDKDDLYILYTRIWDDENKKYDMYALEADGSMYPCYADGGKIMWLGNGSGSLLWDFTEYKREGTNEPSYFYEFYNPYSELYLAPQISGGGQVLSENTIGVNMPGRKNQEYYTDIIAWDDVKYAYVGLRPNTDKTRFEPCAQSVSVPFYFATLESLNLSGELHTVNTVDNTQHGIKMKMINYGYSGSYGNAASCEITKDYFGGFTDRKLNEYLNNPLLSSDLKKDGNFDISGYPTVNRGAKKGTDFGGAFAEAYEVNGLFLESVYNSSGYFEFDSCQNFATLCDENGDLKAPVTDKYKDEDGNYIPTREFTVYRELGTHDASSKNSLKHGQFFPYDIITADSMAVTNAQNKYNSLTTIKASENKGELENDNPRKYEDLHLIQTKAEKDADYYFGMEMEATFVQTYNGKDAWGHDIIFEFTGDDDFWFYVDGELVLDLGGIHSAISGKVNFKTGEVFYDKGYNHYEGSETTNLRDIFINNFTKRYKAEHGGAAPSTAVLNEYLDNYFDVKNGEYEKMFKDYSEHTMRVFYMERGAGASNLHMRFNLASVTPGTVLVSKSISGPGASSIDKDFVEYPFQVWVTRAILDSEGNKIPKTDGEGNILTDDNGNILYETYAPSLLEEKDSEGNPYVKYQNSDQPVEFYEDYQIPGSITYHNVFFINPTRNAEISFPDNTIEYCIVECAVNHNVYPTVHILGPDGENELGEAKQDEDSDYWSYSSRIVSAEQRPSIFFDNVVNDNVVSTLKFTKVLNDKNNNPLIYKPAYEVEEEKERRKTAIKEAHPDYSDEEVEFAAEEEITAWMETNHYDCSVFSFRLSLSPYKIDSSEIPYAELCKYYVVDPEGYICCRDMINDIFVPVKVKDTGEKKKYSDTFVTELSEMTEKAAKSAYGFTIDDIRFNSSFYGSIAKIPSGYSVYVPGLVSGSVFKVEEENLDGYGRDPASEYGHDGYKMIEGYKRKSSSETEEGEEGSETGTGTGTETKIASYECYKGTDIENVGEVLPAIDPVMQITNKRGYGLTAKKVWSDLSITTGHDDIYIGVYVDNALLSGSIKKIEFPDMSAYWFWGDLLTDKKLSDYTVKELMLTNGTPVYDPETHAVTNPASVTVDANGYVISDLSNVTITRLDSGMKQPLHADAKEGSGISSGYYEYVVTYARGESTGSARTDTVYNTRNGGLKIRLFKWDNSDPDTPADDIFDPLEGGEFELYQWDTEQNKYVKKGGTYTSDSEDTVSILYNFEPDKYYKLVQTSAPRGYVGLQEAVVFKFNSTTQAVTLYTASDRDTTDQTGDWTNDPDTNSEKWKQTRQQWAKPRAGEDGIAAFVDVYNKEFQLVIDKSDSKNPIQKLDGAVFALHKQVVATVNGVEMNQFPMLGFETMTTDENGQLIVCGGGTPRTLHPGTKGATYFLIETDPPSGYKKLEKAIVFKLNPLGMPTLQRPITGSINQYEPVPNGKVDDVGGRLVEEDDRFVYTLSVPNVLDKVKLTITKNVEGLMGDKSNDYIFKIEVKGAKTDDKYEWSKNGVTQTSLKSGGTFTLRHNGTAVITVPANTVIKITETADGYTKTFDLGKKGTVIPPDNTNNYDSKTGVWFTLQGDTTLAVTNTYNTTVPTGRHLPEVSVVFAGFLALGVIFLAKRERIRVNGGDDESNDS